MSATSAAVTNSAHDPERQRRRREPGTMVRVACNRCRVRKKSCDSARPICGTCQKRRLDCEFDTDDAGDTRAKALKKEYQKLQDRMVAYESLIPRLRELSQAQVEAIRHRMSQGVDPASSAEYAAIVESVPPRFADPPPPAAHTTFPPLPPPTHSRPETHYRPENEPWAGNPNPLPYFTTPCNSQPTLNSMPNSQPRGLSWSITVRPPPVSNTGGQGAGPIHPGALYRPDPRHTYPDPGT